MADLLVVEGGARPDIHMLAVDEPLPMAGHLAMQSMPAIYGLIRQHRTTLVFVNTRMQAESVFQALWDLNDDGLAIALHHGSLDVAQRRRVEAAMGEGRLKAVVCTSTLDLGIDWGDVDLVVNVGAPKGASPHHAAHRPLEPPHGRALEGVPRAGEPLRDPRMPRRARRRARGGAGHAGCPHRRARRALPAHPRHGLRRAVRRRTSSTTRFAPRRPTPGLTLRGFRRRSSPSSRPAATPCAPTSASPRSGKGTDGLWRVRDGRVAQQYRLNVGTIVEATMIKVRLGRGRAANSPARSCRAAGACSARSRSISPRP